MSINSTYEMKPLKTLLFFSLLASFAQAQQSTWIWYPGDFEINLANKMQNRRTERGSYLLPFWKMDAHYVVMNFHKTVTLSQAEEVDFFVEGEIANVQVSGKNLGNPHKFIVPAGKQTIAIKVYSQATVPAIFIKGKTIVSDGSWKVTNEDKEWIDETGKASDGSGTVWMQAGSWDLNNPLVKPSAFKLPTTLHKPTDLKREGNTLFADFGKETFGFLTLRGVKGSGKINIYYGESKEEALSITDTSGAGR